jgi:hypothetical protein
LFPGLELTSLLGFEEQRTCISQYQKEKSTEGI